MLHKISLNLSEKLVMLGADKSKTAVYAYGLECLLSTAIILVILILGGLLLRRTMDVLIYIAFWVPLRILVGGLHANSHLTCTILSVGLGIAAALFSDFVGALPVLIPIALILICYVEFFMIAPVVHKNHPMSKHRRMIMGRAAKIFTAAEGGIAIALALCNSALFPAAFMGYFCTALLAAIGYFSKNTIKSFD